MKNTVTISVRSLVLAIGGCLALLAAYAIGNGSAPASAGNTAAANDSADTPKIVMTASGQATAVPDQVSFRLAIDARSSDISSGLAQTSRTTRRVLAALNDAGVARRDTQTTGLDIRAVYDYSGDGPGVIVGYSVSEDLAVLIRSLPDAGKVIDAAVRAGGNAVRLHDLQLKVGNEEALMKTARDDAVSEATTKAEQYAEATGQTLGRVLSIKEISGTQHAVPVARRGAFDSAAVPIRAGQADLKVTVSIVWAFS